MCSKDSLQGCLLLLDDGCILSRFNNKDTERPRHYMDPLLIEKIVPGGRGLTRTPDGRVCFVWGALPGERVTLEITKKRKSYMEALVADVIEASADRVKPRDAAYLSTSPWQVASFDAENRMKCEVIVDAFGQQSIDLPEFSLQTDGREWGYRNKMEYSFWWTPETDTVDLAFHKRASRAKVPTNSSSLAMESINAVSEAMKAEVNRLSIMARNLKSIVIRSTQGGAAYASIFAKDDIPELDQIELPVEGLEIWLSDPKSPASVQTKLLHQKGAENMSDTVCGRSFSYGVNSFFQVNVPMYELAIKDIRSMVDPGLPTVDMFSGVGSIGLSVADRPELIETDGDSTKWARVNAAGEADVTRSKSEDALDHIARDQNLILDPPRAGLHKKVIEKISEAMPSRVIYMSCEASTHARDVRLLMDAGYRLARFSAYNFFPKTPHTETLALLLAPGIDDLA